MKRFLDVLYFIGFLLGLSYVMISCATVSSTRFKPNLPKYGTFGKDEKVYEGLIRLKDDKGQFFCSAFVIDDNYAATAAHCLERDYNSFFTHQIQIASEDGTDTHIRAESVAINTRMDYGLIKGDFRKFKSFKLDLRLNSIYTEKVLVSCGYPLDQKGSYCVPVLPVGNSYFHIRARGFIYPGMSGGPVLNITTKEVIAINSATAEDVVLLAPVIGLLSSFGVE